MPVSIFKTTQCDPKLGVLPPLTCNGGDEAQFEQAAKDKQLSVPYNWTPAESKRSCVAEHTEDKHLMGQSTRVYYRVVNVGDYFPAGRLNVKQYSLKTELPGESDLPVCLPLTRQLFSALQASSG